MDNQVFSKLNLYDQIGYFLVGSIAIIAIVFDLMLLGKSNLIPSISATNFIIYFIVSYFTGHIIQAIANLVIFEKKDVFEESDIKILSEAKTFFNVKKASLRELYSLCYMFSVANDITGQVSHFNALYSLYRGWFIIFSSESIFFLIMLILKWFNITFLILLIVSILLSFLFYKRLKRFFNYSRQKTLQTFLIVKNKKS